MKQSVADQIDSVLKELEVDRDTLATLKSDYLFFASYDLFDAFDAIVSLNTRANKVPSRPRIDLLEELPKVDFRELCRSRIPKADLPQPDAAILEEFADQVADIVEKCRKTGRVTNEAIELIDAHEQTDKLTLYRRLFKQEPTIQ